jgi:hypothetical protein
VYNPHLSKGRLAERSGNSKQLLAEQSFFRFWSGQIFIGVLIGSFAVGW